MLDVVQARILRIALGLALSLVVAATHAAPFAYVTNQDGASVSVIDLARDAVTATIGVGVLPTGIAVNPAGTRVYVAHQNGIAVIDSATHTLLTTVAVAGDAIDVVVLPSGDRVYAVGAASRKVWSIDATTNTVLHTIDLPTDGYAIAANGDGSRVVVARNDNALSVISTVSDSIELTFPVVGAQALAIDAARNVAYVSSPGLELVRQIDLASGAAQRTYAGVSDAYALAVNPAGTRVYAASFIDPKVWVMDTTDGSSTFLATEHSGTDVAVDARRDRLIVTNRDQDTVTFRPLTSGAETTLEVGNGPAFIAMRPSLMFFEDGFE